MSVRYAKKLEDNENIPYLFLFKNNLAYYLAERYSLSASNKYECDADYAEMLAREAYEATKITEIKEKFKTSYNEKTYYYWIETYAFVLWIFFKEKKIRKITKLLSELINENITDDYYIETKNKWEKDPYWKKHFKDIKYKTGK